MDKTRIPFETEMHTMKLATSSQMRELDRRAIQERGIPSIDLMERAAAGVAEAVLELLPLRPGRARVSALCGAGNNGGDGIAAARLLFLRGVSVRVFLVGSYERLTPDAMEETWSPLTRSARSRPTGF